MTFIEVKEKENKPIDGHISTDDISLVYLSGNDTIIKTRDGACYTALQSMDSYEIATLSGVIIPAETGYAEWEHHDEKLNKSEAVAA